MNKQLAAYLIVTLAAARGTLVLAEDRLPPTAEDVTKAQNCVPQENNLLRLKCYDAAMHRAAKRPVQDQDFGLSAAQVVAKEQLTEPIKAMSVVVTMVDPLSHGGIRLTLANQQVWVDEESDAASFPIKPGDSVNITSGALGGYLLTGSESRHRSIKVKRIR